MNVPEVLARIVTGLNDAGIKYMLCGSFASSFYGAPRSSQDIDFVIEATPTQLQKLVESLPKAEYYVDLNAALEAYRNQSQFNIIDLATGWKIDLIIRKSRPFSHSELDRRRQIDLHGLPIFVASAEDVIVAKLEWSKRSHSKRQIEDVVGVLRTQWEALDHAYLQNWTSALGLEKEWNEAQRESGLS